MRLDVLILAGGRATRLRQLWGQPKCLVPVGGAPVIDRILDAVVPLKPGFVCLALSIGRRLITDHLECEHNRDFTIVVSNESKPSGTSRAVGTAIRRGLVGAPLMVLNGDTLPMYDLLWLASSHQATPGTWATMAVTRDENTSRDFYAGACVLSEAAMLEIEADSRTRDFPAHLIGARRLVVPGFLDVGTPESFQRAKEWQS